jgi:hypothetical protein
MCVHTRFSEECNSKLMNDHDPTPAQIDALAGLKAAIRSKDSLKVETALAKIWTAGLHPEVCGALIRLVEERWHTLHEDTVRGIQQLRCAGAVPALERAAHAIYEYLDYDEFFGLARKCTWALADIGTPEAYRALERLSKSSNLLIGGYAIKRLVRWQDEVARKPR